MFYQLGYLKHMVSFLTFMLANLFFMFVLMDAKTKTTMGCLKIPFGKNSNKETCPEIFSLAHMSFSPCISKFRNPHQNSLRFIFKPQFLNLYDSPYMLPSDSSYTLL